MWRAWRPASGCGSTAAPQRCIWLSEDAGGTQAAEFVLVYAKPGPYRATLDLLDADGFWLTTLAETPLEIAFPEEATGWARRLRLAGPLTRNAWTSGRHSTEPQAWLPYRYVKPIRSGLATYTTPAAAGSAAA